MMDLDQRRESDRTLCYREGDYLILNSGMDPYEVPLSRCDTAEKLLGWVVHLGEKTWLTPRMTKLFVLMASEANEIAVDRGA